MDWMKIGSALLVGTMIVVMWPRAKHMLTNSPKAPPGAWQNVALIILAVMGFVALLVMMVR
jgi:hypothetical protein